MTIRALFPPLWAAKYIGGSFQKYGDCVGLCQLVMREQTGIEVTRADIYPGEHNALDPKFIKERTGVPPWTKIVALGDEQTYDWCVLWTLRGKTAVPLHVGIVTAPGWLLHVQEDVAACQQRIAQLASRIVLFVRHDKLA